MKKSIILYILLIAVVLNSCTEPFNPALGESAKFLRVEGYITTDTTAHKVILWQSSHVYDTLAPSTVTGAIVSISDGTNTFELTESLEKPGYYYTSPDVFGVPGKTYTLKVENVDINDDGEFDIISASSHLYDTNPIDSIKLEYIDRPHSNGWNVNCYAKDPLGENYYMFNLRVNDVLLSDTIGIKTFTDDKIFDGSYTNGISLYFILKEKPNEGESWPGMIYIPKGLHDGDTITAEISGISKDYFTYLNEATSQDFGYNPMFGGAPGNIFSNIEPSDMAVGVFAAYSIKASSYIYKEATAKK